MSPTRSGSWPIQKLVVGLVAIAAAMVAAVWLLQRDDPAESPAGEAGVTGSPTIAVLPFSDAGEDPGPQYFSVGLTEEIITELSRYRELAVIAHFATADFIAEHADAGLDEIGRVLDAQYVLRGSVFREGDRIRINVRLSDTREQREVWGTTYERDLTVHNLFDIQDDITQQVVSQIAGTYGAVARAGLTAIRGKPPASLSSYECVLRAYDYLQNHDAENHAKARDCLERVVEAEPDYADGVAWLGYLYAEEYHHRRNERPEEYDALTRALELGLEAARLDNASHVTHGTLSLTYYFRGEYERAEAENRRAMELAPNNAMWLAIMGLYYIQREQYAEGVPMVTRAMELFTPHPPPWVRMGSFLDHYAHGRYEEALDEIQATDLGDDFRLPFFIAATYGQLGRVEEAGPVIEELRRQFPLPLGELRQEMLERQAFTPGLTDHLIEGLALCGVDFDS